MFWVWSFKIGFKDDLTAKDKCLISSKFVNCKTILELAKMITRYHQNVKKFVEDPRWLWQGQIEDFILPNHVLDQEKSYKNPSVSSYGSFRYWKTQVSNCKSSGKIYETDHSYL